ncbi:hypothetical protein [Arthrobacter sp. MYb227]|uniref:hypothetical protein n=1 Tax=Arthrobacter sp. MYb227 TaxID=1848601 RepID=UPI0015E3530A|nr:hypothetical protein [Arthrobacter sp. MYb227]
MNTLRASITLLTEENPDLLLVACGMVEDLTGFFVTGTDAKWLGGLIGAEEEKSQIAWLPSEWPVSGVDPSDAAPGRVTSAIWELSGTQAMIDGTGSELCEDDYNALRVDYEDRMILALRQLQTEGALRNARGRDIWIWLHSADYSDEELDDRSFAALHSPELAAQFHGRWGAGTEPLLKKMTSLYR